MKFTINNVGSNAARLGRLFDFHRIPDLSLETPALLLYAKGGCVPHLTYEVLQFVSKEKHCLHVPLTSTIHCESSVAEYNKCLAEFIGMKEYLTYCAVQDAGSELKTTTCDTDKVSVWTRHGNACITAERYMDVMESFKPDIYQALCDGNTYTNSSKRRAQKAASSTGNFLKKCLERHYSSEALKNSSILGVIEGGFNLCERTAAAKSVGEQDVDGFVIDGLNANCTEVERLEAKDFKYIVEETVKYLPENKVRFIHGAWTPENIMLLIEMGLDVFDSTLAYTVTERGGALNFCNTLELRVSGEEMEKYEDLQKQDNYYMSLGSSIYKDDFQPLVKVCNCITCQEHSRAYIHHLLNTKELLGSVLLMIHNLHHSLQFFKSIRQALKKNEFDLLKSKIKLILK